MNVFVLCTGRCGSTTFARACHHITNFSSGHETRSRLVGTARLDYPPNHIEADNRLSWMLGRLEQRFGDDAFYVHLTRNQDLVAASFNERWYDPAGIARAYRYGILMNSAAEPIDICRDMIDTVTANIELFLSTKSQVMNFKLEQAAEQWPVFWDWIGAEGDAPAAAAEWEKRHNERSQGRLRPRRFIRTKLLDLATNW